MLPLLQHLYMSKKAQAAQGFPRPVRRAWQQSITKAMSPSVTRALLPRCMVRAGVVLCGCPTAASRPTTLCFVACDDSQVCIRRAFVPVNEMQASLDTDNDRHCQVKHCNMTLAISKVQADKELEDSDKASNTMNLRAHEAHTRNCCPETCGFCKISVGVSCQLHAAAMFD